MLHESLGLILNGDPSFLEPLLEKMPWDAVNTGNHELYHNSVMEYMTRPGGFVEWFDDRFLTANIRFADDGEPLGARYKVLKGKNANVLTFGFLYDMTNNADFVHVHTVESVLAESWFTAALKNEEYGAILVLAHMDYKDPLVDVILDKVRSVVGDTMPVQFITGHSHIRAYRRPDNASASFEAGRYLDTIGFSSFPTKASYVAHQNATFEHRFINATEETLKATLGVDTLATNNGMALSRFIQRTREELGLTEPVGCLKESYYLNRSLASPESVYRFYGEKIVPQTFGVEDVLFYQQGAFRYDLLGGGEMTVDDVIVVSPFNESFVAWHSVPAEAIVQLNATMNAADLREPLEVAGVPTYVLYSVLPFTPSNRNYTLVVSPNAAPAVQQVLTDFDPALAGVQPVPTGIYATQLWIDYFREHEPCSSSSSNSGADHSHMHGRPTTSHPTNPTTTTWSVSNEQLDQARIAFAVVAVVVVLALAAVNVRQRSVIHRRLTDQREFATLEAMRELEDDPDGSEGEFV